MLSSYPLHIKKVSQKLEKNIYPLEIIGDYGIKVSPKFIPFIKSLIHLFNNSVDHGIECAEKRVKNGKDEIGTITCRYQKVGGELVLEISDDGGGIEIEKIVKKSINNGLKTVQECEAMSENEKLELIFEDKLSTKDVATTTSGRGVGMSALKSELEKIGGEVKIENSIGKGVKFVFTLKED